jgi:hypothetical protein
MKCVRAAYSELMGEGRTLLHKYRFSLRETRKQNISRVSVRESNSVLWSSNHHLDNHYRIFKEFKTFI